MKKAARKRHDSFFEKQQEIVEEVVIEEKKIVSSKMKLFKQRKYQVGFLVLIIIIVGALVAGYGFVNNGNNAIDGGKLSPSQVNSLIAEVGSKMVIPKGETPTIATVTDVTKLEGQPFFRNAQNGDKVMIFGSTNTAILYRQSIHKIVTVAPINAQTNPVAAGGSSSTNQNPQTSITPTVSPTPGNSEPIKIAILNGTKVAGLAKKAEALIKSDNVEVVSLGNTTGDYATSSISTMPEVAKLSEDEFLVVISPLNVKPKPISLPAGETAPAGAEYILILGKDFADAQK